MKQSMVLILLSALPVVLLSAEPSAFGAGDVNSPNPYGLTSNEKVILDTKKKLHTVAVKSNNQANQLDSLRERIDGLQSIIESLSRKAHNNKVNLKKQLQEREKSLASKDEYEQRLADVVKVNELAIKEQQTLLDQQKVVMLEMSTLIDSINQNYVSKNDFNALVDDVNKFKTLVAKELKSSPKKNRAQSSSMSSSDLYNQAKKYYNKKLYTKSIDAYEQLIKRKYKPAYAHYMIGDMNYKRKNYAEAISYYKKSSSLYSKALYMPALMLHTAVSMSKTGDKAHAKAFFKAIVAKYPSTVEAKEAREYLQP